MSTLSECPVAHFAHVTQILAGQALEWFEPPTRERLEDRFQFMESPALEVGRLAVESALRCFAWRLANTIHRNFHARFRHATPCGFAARELTLVRGDEGDVFVRASIAVWAECFRKDFLAAHDSASHRARRLLERSAATSMTVGRLSRDVGVGHRTLERQFRTEIGMSIAEYRTRRRLVEAVRQLHGEQGSIESAAFNAGWTSKKGLYEALDEHVGMKPADIRTLSSAEKDSLMASLAMCGKAAGAASIVQNGRPWNVHGTPHSKPTRRTTHY